MKKILFSTLVLTVAFLLLTSFPVLKTSAQNEGEENKNEEVKYVPVKAGEIKVPKISERMLGRDFKDIDEFVRENIAEHPGANFFMLFPKGKAAGQGVVNSFDGTQLVLDSQGYKTTWNVSTDTMILASTNLRLLAQANPLPVTTSSLNVGDRVKVLGNWDGEKLVAKKIISLKPKVPQITSKKVETLLEKIKEAFEKAGISIDLTPLLKQLPQQ